TSRTHQPARTLHAPSNMLSPSPENGWPAFPQPRATPAEAHAAPLAAAARSPSTGGLLRQAGGGPETGTAAGQRPTPAAPGTRLDLPYTRLTPPRMQFEVPYRRLEVLPSATFAAPLEIRTGP